ARVALVDGDRCVCVCVCLCVCLSLSLSLSLCVCVCLFNTHRERERESMCVCVCVSVCVCVCVCVSESWGEEKRNLSLCYYNSYQRAGAVWFGRSSAGTKWYSHHQSHTTSLLKYRKRMAN